LNNSKQIGINEDLVNLEGLSESLVGGPGLAHAFGCMLLWSPTTNAQPHPSLRTPANAHRCIIPPHPDALSSIGGQLSISFNQKLQSLQVRA